MNHQANIKASTQIMDDQPITFIALSVPIFQDDTRTTFRDRVLSMAESYWEMLSCGETNHSSQDTTFTLFQLMKAKDWLEKYDPGYRDDPGYLWDENKDWHM